jgi:quinol monooxygenase YgiN
VCRAGENELRAWTGACTPSGMSTIINESETVVTFINVFDVEPHKQDDLIELLERAVVDVMQYLDGFISANIHRGLDGKHVANYAQWARREDFEAMLAHPKVQEHIRLAGTIARSAPALYRVDSVLDRTP